MDELQKNEFAQAASETNRGGLISELWYFIGHNKKWWLIPFVTVLLMLGGLVFLAGTGAAPFIYTLF
jgi:Family of unknown function (DUF5989)